MAVEQVKVPSPGESVTEGRIAKWYAADGAAVKVDDPLFELESDKAAQTVTAQTTGVLRIKVKEGETVAIGAVVAEIDGAGKASGGRQSPEKSSPKESASPATPKAPPEETPRGTDVPRSPATAPVAVQETGDRKQEAKNGPPPPAPASRPTARETRQPMSMIRKRTAERLLESRNTTATLTTFNEADMSAVMEMRAKYNERFEKRHGVKLGFMSVFVKAVVEALKAFPVVNARIDGDEIVQQTFYDISVAVSTDKGLFVPVLRDADQFGFADIEKRIAELAKRAKDGKIGVPDMLGGTFTITNGGVFGSLLSTPILNPPQTAILGMHTIQKRPVVVNDQIVIRPMMYVALSYDHRLIDGREAVQFLVRVKEYVENPERMLFGV